MHVIAMALCFQLIDLSVVLVPCWLIYLLLALWLVLGFLLWCDGLNIGRVSLEEVVTFLSCLFISSLLGVVKYCRQRANLLFLLFWIVFPAQSRSTAAGYPGTVARCTGTLVPTLLLMLPLQSRLCIIAHRQLELSVRRTRLDVYFAPLSKAHVWCSESCWMC